MNDPRPADSDATWAVPLSDVLVEDDLVEAARQTLESGWWSMGPRVESFEREFASVCESQHALAVANGTAALHIALLAVGCGPGDEVVLPSLNFVAAANAVLHTGATPVFCDVRGERDLNLDPSDLEAAITPATRAVIALHYGGHPCAIDDVVALCRARGVAVVEDAAHAIGARRSGVPCGSFGDAGCFSFFSNKNLPVGEGGMIVTDDASLAAEMRLLRSHGMTTLTWDRHRGHASTYDVVRPGFNYRLDELRAALGSVQLASLPARDEARRAHARRYRAALDGRLGLVVPFTDDEAAACHLAVVVLPAGSPRDDIRARLAEKRIQTSVHYPPIHGLSAFASIGARRALPRTAELADRILTLPLYPHMTEADVDLVSAELLDAVGAAGVPDEKYG
jgi:dTDP-4-amino-4,6-dideoxygalactose transaminase